jgi:hypothetical protein
MHTRWCKDVFHKAIPGIIEVYRTFQGKVCRFSTGFCERVDEHTCYLSAAREQFAGNFHCAGAVRWAARRLLWFTFGLALSTACAKAATCAIPSGAGQAVIAATIQSCGSGNTVVFAAGDYQIASGIYVPCGVSLSGPQVPWSNPSRYTATIKSTVAGAAAFSFAGCSTPASVEYLNFDGGQPSPDGGQILYFPAGTSNMTVSNNYFHGNQGNATDPEFIDSLVYFDGYLGSPISSDDTITWNIFGGPNTNDCSNLMDNYTYSGLGGNGGMCNGLGLHSGFENLLVENNIFQYMEQGMKVYEATGQCVNCVIEYNDYNHIHRINFETQAYMGESNPITSMLIRYNSIHDQYAPNFGAWGFSAANGCSTSCITNTDYNVIINNVLANSSGFYTPGAIEVWGSAGTTSNYNLIQGYWANGIMTSETGQFTYNNNILCMAYGGSPTPPGNGGYFNDETSNAQVGVPSYTGNTIIASATCPQTSTTPMISPAGGSFSAPQTVTFFNPGTNLNANTGIWYTTDGTTPVPGAGTAKYIASGGSITLSSSATIRAVGMWGAANQPVSYPAGYGFVPSSVVTAQFIGGGVSTQKSQSTEPTLVSVALHPKYGGATLRKGGTMQMVAQATYSDGTTGTLPDQQGNVVTWWNTSDHAVVKISAAGHVTAVGPGSANLEAMVGPLKVRPWSVTVSSESAPVSSTKTITGGYLGNSGSVNTAAPGGPAIQFTAYAIYSDGTVGTLPDSFGNSAVWSSSDPAVCTVSSTGLFSPVSVGTCSINVVTSPGRVPLNSWGMTIGG